MNSELLDEIINLLPSDELRKTVFEKNIAFSEQDLLKIVYHYAPDYDIRLCLLDRLCHTFSGKLKEYTELLAKRQRFCLEAFSKCEENTIFELHIKDRPDAYDERYVCCSYEAALKLIPLFYREYECEPTDETYYKIEKRKLFCGRDDEPFSEDYLGVAEFLSSGKLYSVDVNDLCSGIADCSDCDRICVLDSEMEFPRVIERGDIVKFRYSLAQPERIGVVPFFCKSETECEYYVIPLDCADMRYHHFDTEFWDHEHIPAPLVRKIPLESLDEKMREDYLAFMEYLKNTGENHEWE